MSTLRGIHRADILLLQPLFSQLSVRFSAIFNSWWSALLECTVWCPLQFRLPFAFLFVTIIWMDRGKFLFLKDDCNQVLICFPFTLTPPRLLFISHVQPSSSLQHVPLFSVLLLKANFKSVLCTFQFLDALSFDRHGTHLLRFLT